MKDLFLQLESKIESAYKDGITLEEAEKLAFHLNYVNLQISTELQSTDLDARMRKSGLKAIRAAIYMEAATKTDKKPSDVMLQAIVDMNELVQGEQRSLDQAEVLKAHLERVYDTFLNAHIHCRKVAGGTFGG